MTDADFVKEAQRKLGLSDSQMSRMLGFKTEPGKRSGRTLRYIKAGGRQIAPGVWQASPLMGCQRRLIEAYLEGYRPPDWPKPRTQTEET